MAVRADLSTAAVVSSDGTDAPGIAPGRHRGTGTSGASRATALALAAGVAAVALLARLVRVDRAHEIHIDEVSYAEVARNLALGQQLLIHGTPFHLHPPGYLALLAAVQRALGVEPDLLGAVLQLRPVGAVLGAATCVVLALMLRRLVGLPAAALAGTYLALDPFANRFDSRVFLEAPAMLMAATAISCLTAASAQRAHGPSGRLLVGAGLAVGGAILVKEPYALITAAPLLVLLVTGWALRRRDALTVLGVAGLCYAGYVAGIALTGQWEPWQREKLSGVRRLLGVEQTTGFNAPGGDRLLDRLLHHALELGPTYLVIAAGALGLLAWAAVQALGRRRTLGSRGTPGRGAALDRRRPAPDGPSLVVLVWLASAGGYLTFAVAFGTVEEQTFTLVLTPALAAAAVLAAWAWRRPRPTRSAADRVTGAARTAIAALASLALLGAGAAWSSVHTADDDGYARLVPWVEANVPDGSRVAVTEDVAQFLLRGVEITTAGTVPALVERRADYLLVSTGLAERGFGIARPSVLRELDGRAPVVFSHAGPGLGELRLYDVRAVTGGSDRAGLQDGPPPADAPVAPQTPTAPQEAP